MLDSKPDFQLNIKKAGALILEREVQIVYLIATLSLNDKAEFLDIIKVEIPNNCKFYSCTSCLNIAYLVVKHNNKQIEAVC